MGQWISAEVGFGFEIPESSDGDEFDFKDAWTRLDLPNVVLYGDKEYEVDEDKTDYDEFEKALRTKFPALAVYSSYINDYTQGIVILVKSTVQETWNGVSKLGEGLALPNVDEFDQLIQVGKAFDLPVSATEPMYNHMLVISYG